MNNAIAAALGRNVFVPSQPQFSCALGAAILAERLAKEGKV